MVAAPTTPPRPHILTLSRIYSSTPFFHQTRSLSPRLFLHVLSPGSTNPSLRLQNHRKPFLTGYLSRARGRKTTPAQEKDSRRDRDSNTKPQTKHLTLCQQTQKVRVKMASAKCDDKAACPTKLVRARFSISVAASSCVSRKCAYRTWFTNVSICSTATVTFSVNAREHFQ